MKKSNIYYIFDLVKFVLSLFVVQIHIGMFSTYSLIFDDILKNWIGRIAVPLYFIISSYLLFSKVDLIDLFSHDNILVYRKYFKRLILLYISWGIIYFVCLHFFYKINILEFVFDFLFVGFYRQFWFLNSQIFGTFFLLLLLRVFSLKFIILLAFFFYFVGLILVPYNFVFVDLFSFVPVYNGDILLCRNFFTFGLLYISLGMFFSQRINVNISVKKNIFFLLFFVVLSLGEFLFLKAHNCSYYALQLFIPFVSFVLFQLLSKIKLKYNKRYFKLRQYSILIFCLHALVYLFLDKYLAFITNNSLFIYFFTILICILISKFIIFINDKYIKFKFLY